MSEQITCTQATLTAGNASEVERIRMNKLAAALVLTSQGISFLHAGEEVGIAQCSHGFGIFARHAVHQAVVAIAARHAGR